MHVDYIDKVAPASRDSGDTAHMRKFDEVAAWISSIRADAVGKRSNNSAVQLCYAKAREVRCNDCLIIDDIREGWNGKE